MPSGLPLEAVQDLARRRWKTKPWTAKNGNRRCALPITKSRLHHLLTNVTYMGKIRYKDEVHEGEHEAILRDTLLAGSGKPPQTTFEQYLRLMPDVGTDDDFSRIEGSIRDVDLTK